MINRELIEKFYSVLPAFASETGAEGEPVLEALYCVSYEHGPKRREDGLPVKVCIARRTSQGDMDIVAEYKILPSTVRKEKIDFKAEESLISDLEAGRMAWTEAPPFP